MTVGALVLVGGGLIGALALSPPASSISLVGSSTVASGGTFHVHGVGFSAGSSVKLTLDGHIPLAVQGHAATGFAAGAMSSTALQALFGGQLQQPTLSQGGINVSGDGTFDATIVVSEQWSLGSHTLRATEGVGSRSAQLTFTIMPKPVTLNVRPSSLDLGQLSVGSKISPSFVISNIGQQTLKWAADAGGTNWVQLQEVAGAIQPGGFQQLTLLVDTSGLSAGDHAATLHINSSGGNKAVGITLSITKTVPKVAKLYVNATNLDFGQLPVEQSAAFAISIGNVGTQALNWKADVGSTAWLALDLNSGTLQPGGLQAILVNADTTNLIAGNYSAVLQISSNGGTAQIGVNLVVTGSKPPIPTPTLQAGPTSFSAPHDPNCAYDASQGWACVADLSSLKSAQGNLDWSVASSGINGVTFSQSSGSIAPGGTAKVTINIPNTTCPAQADFTFTGPANKVDIPWSCAPATLHASPSSFSDGCLSCVVTLSLASGSEGELSWSASSDVISGVTINPSSSTISPGQKQQVTFSFPPVTCPADDDLHFTGPNNGVDIHISWSCQKPTMTVSPGSITANSDCTYSNGWTCQVMVGNDASSQGNLNWSASASGINGISFSPASDSLPPGKQEPVTVSVPGTTCPTQASLNFTGGAIPMTVTWNCLPPTLTASPDHFNVPDPNCSYTPASDSSAGSWACTETLALSNKGDPNLDWSTPASVGGSSAIQYNPANGTLTAGQPQQVTITIPEMVCPPSANVTLSFLISGGNTVTIPWTCAAAALNFSPSGHFTCPANSDGSWTCNVTLSEDASAQGDLNWSVTSDLTGVTYNPGSSGMLTPGASTALTITIPPNDCPTGKFTFTGGANPVVVTWHCTATPTPTPPPAPPPTPTPTPPPAPPPTPTLNVSPGSLDNTSASSCSSDNTTNTWSCTVTLSEDASAQGNINWTASSSISGVSFSQPGGTLAPGQSTQVTISGIACSNGTFTFTGGANPVTVSWTCS